MVHRGAAGTDPDTLAQESRVIKIAQSYACGRCPSLALQSVWRQRSILTIPHPPVSGKSSCHWLADRIHRPVAQNTTEEHESLSVVRSQRSVELPPGEDDRGRNTKRRPGYIVVARADAVIELPFRSDVLADAAWRVLTLG
jgi:hypothetical protein